MNPEYLSGDAGRLLAVAPLLGIIHLPNSFWVHRTLEFMMACEVAALYICISILVQEYGICEKCRRKKGKNPSEPNEPSADKVGPLGNRHIKFANVSHHLKKCVLWPLVCVSQLFQCGANGCNSLLNLPGFTHRRSMPNKIIGESLKNNEAYLRYLWINDLGNNAGKTVVYIPTEANLPILEATRHVK